MNKKTKAFIYNFVGFAIFFFGTRYVVDSYTNLEGWWVPLTAFAVGLILAPKFQAVNTKDGEKLFMQWIFTKGLKEIK